MTRAICIGECMLELRPAEGGHLRRGFAGDAYNTAVYLKRSAPQLDVAFLTATGDDSLSQSMIACWRDEGISDDWVFQIPGRRPALYLIETDGRGERIFHYWRAESPAKFWLEQLLLRGGSEILDAADLVYVSGISLAILSEEDRAAAIGLFSRLKTKIAFDPNVRPLLWKSMEDAKDCFESMARMASIILPSRQDYELIYGIGDPYQQIALTMALTDAEIALTLDVAGCLLRVGDTLLALPSMAKTVVDTSGAGDSFNGAYLAARLCGYSPGESAEAGLKLAGTVVAKAGAIIPKP